MIVYSLNPIHISYKFINFILKSVNKETITKCSTIIHVTRIIVNSFIESTITKTNTNVLREGKYAYQYTYWLILYTQTKHYRVKSFTEHNKCCAETTIFIYLYYVRLDRQKFIFYIPTYVELGAETVFFAGRTLSSIKHYSNENEVPAFFTVRQHICNL